MKTPAAQNESVNEQPRVSVILPCYPLTRCPDEAVHSVLSQTLLDLEIIIVTSECAVESHFPGTRIISSEKQNRSTMCNLGVQSAAGQYICVMAADDKLETPYLEKATQILDGDPSVAIVSAWLRISGAEEQVQKRDQWDLAALLCERVVPRAALVRKAALEEIGGYDEKIPIPDLEDWDVWVNLSERGSQICVIPEILVQHQKRSDASASTAIDAEARLRSWRYLVEKHRNSYHQHLLDALLARDDEVSELLRGNYERERYLDSWLVPEVDRRKEELEGLKQKLRRAETIEVEELKCQLRCAEYRVGQLTAALTRSQEEIVMLKASRSWQITAPLRFVYDSLTRFSGNLTKAVPQVSTEKRVDQWHSLENESVPTGYSTGRLDKVPVKWGDLSRTTPISPEWGADRGRCIDRYYIEEFLEANANDIQGWVLEVHDNDYTTQFGGDRVEQSDVIDIDPTNSRATIITDLCKTSLIPAHAYDCFIMTQTLHVIYDMRAALAECVRILKPGGVLLATLPCASKVAHEQGLDGDFWRFTEPAALELFGEFFARDRLEVRAPGNVLVNVAYLYGLACHEISSADFKVHDPFCPLVVCIRAQTA
jgi:GT2 family glycosyltransferase